jgi:CheY-like chemotaxis protein
MADPTNIHQVIVNLCTNAFHAMENEKGVLSVLLQREEIGPEQTAKEPGAEPGPYILLQVSDTGQGMDPKTVERIFDPYFTTKEVGKGTGLGLAVVHGIVQDHNGFIRVDSTPGEGSSFRIYLPVALEATDDESNEKETPEYAPTGDERILVVDDERILANLHSTILRDLGYTVTTATASIEALELFRHDPGQFDLIITDQTMPALTGAELAQEILKIRPDFPIILCTGYSSVFSREEAQGIGIKQYLTKPVLRTTLAQIVRQVLDENDDGEQGIE